MSAVVLTMPRLLRPVDHAVCIPITCKDCGIYNLCHEPNGSDVDPALLETIVRSRKMFKRGELLYRSGEPQRAIYAICGGSVKTQILNDAGQIQITGFHVNGELLGLAALATHQHNSEARVLETALICEVPIDVWEAYGESIPAMRRQTLKLLSQEILDHQEMLLLLGKKNAEGRLATFLLNLSRRFQQRNYSSSQFNLSMSRGDIGNYLGLAEETVCRVFTRFQDDGLLTSDRRRIHLHDMKRLISISRS